MKVLYDDPNFSVVYYPLDKVMVATRKASDASVEEALGSMRKALAIDVREYMPYAMILDVRAVIGRSDPNFERATAELRGIAQRQVTRFVTLVATVAGALQVRRMSAESGYPLLVATTEEEAFRLARGGA